MCEAPSGELCRKTESALVRFPKSSLNRSFCAAESAPWFEAARSSCVGIPRSDAEPVSSLALATWSRQNELVHSRVRSVLRRRADGVGASGRLGLQCDRAESPAG